MSTSPVSLEPNALNILAFCLRLRPQDLDDEGTAKAVPLYMLCGSFPNVPAGLLLDLVEGRKTPSDLLGVPLIENGIQATADAQEKTWERAGFPPLTVTTTASGAEVGHVAKMSGTDDDGTLRLDHACAECGSPDLCRCRPWDAAASGAEVTT